MSQYDSKRFATEFSRRTQANLSFIEDAVQSDQNIEDYTDELLEELGKINNEIDNLKNRLCTEANDIKNIRYKGKDELKSRLHSMATKLDNSKKNLNEKSRKLDISSQKKRDKLYEVTQLLNSLMGIAVLPYEMYKEIFFMNHEIKREIRRKIEKSDQYRSLQSFIMDLYNARKWNSTYSSDLSDVNDNCRINKDNVVFNFLRHVRNAVCHSGDDGTLSILPLSDGIIIEEILFYDKNIKKQEEEFGMRLSVAEVRKMVEQIADFYRMSLLGDIDKTETIKKAEERVKSILENAKQE